MFSQQNKGLCARYTFYPVLRQARYTRPWELARVQHLPPNLPWPSQSTASELGLLLVCPINELRRLQLFPSPCFLLALPNETGTEEAGRCSVWGTPSAGRQGTLCRVSDAGSCLGEGRDQLRSEASLEGGEEAPNPYSISWFVGIWGGRPTNSQRKTRILIINYECLMLI